MSPSRVTLSVALGSLSICPTSLNATDKKKVVARITPYTANRLLDAVEYLLMMTAISRAFVGNGWIWVILEWDTR